MAIAIHVRAGDSGAGQFPETVVWKLSWPSITDFSILAEWWSGSFPHGEPPEMRLP
jgi:hypothetical protein